MFDIIQISLIMSQYLPKKYSYWTGLQRLMTELQGLSTYQKSIVLGQNFVSIKEFKDESQYLPKKYSSWTIIYLVSGCVLFVSVPTKKV